MNRPQLVLATMLLPLTTAACGSDDATTSDTPPLGTGGSTSATPSTSPEQPPTTTTASASTTSPSTSSDPPDRRAALALIRAQPAEPTADGFPPATDGALLEGILVETDGCFAVDWGGDRPTPVIWPHGTTLDGNVFTIGDDSFAVGDSLSLGGGATPTPESVVEPGSVSEALRCASALEQQLFDAGNVIVTPR